MGLSQNEINTVAEAMQHMAQLEVIVAEDVKNMLSEVRSLTKMRAAMDERISHLNKSIVAIREKCPHDLQYVARSSAGDGYKCTICEHFEIQ